MKLKDKIIFITGAAKGIGFELAKQLSEKSNTVIIGARKGIALQEISDEYPSLNTVFFDALDEQCLKEVAIYLDKNYSKIDVLINNAAICNSYDFFEKDISFKEINDEIETNVSSPIKLTKLLIPLLNQASETAIINITSAVAYLPMPSLPVYSATKAALQSFTTSLRVSLQQTKISVFEALPPLVDTQMTSNLIGEGKNMAKMSPKKCASAIIKGVENNQKTIHIGSSKSLFWGSRFFPSFVQKQINKM